MFNIDELVDEAVGRFFDEPPFESDDLVDDKVAGLRINYALQDAVGETVDDLNAYHALIILKADEGLLTREVPVGKDDVNDLLFGGTLTPLVVLNYAIGEEVFDRAAKKIVERYDRDEILLEWIRHYRDEMRASRELHAMPEEPQTDPLAPGRDHEE